LLIVDDNTGMRKWKEKMRVRNENAERIKLLSVKLLIYSFRRQMRVIKELIKITSAGSHIFSELYSGSSIRSIELLSLMLRPP